MRTSPGWKGIVAEGTAYPDRMTAYPDRMTAYPDGMTAYPDRMTAYPDRMTAYPDAMTAYRDEGIASPDEEDNRRAREEGYLAGVDGLVVDPGPSLRGGGTRLREANLDAAEVGVPLVDVAEFLDDGDACPVDVPFDREAPRDSTAGGRYPTRQLCVSSRSSATPALARRPSRPRVWDAMQRSGASLVGRCSEPDPIHLPYHARPYCTGPGIVAPSERAARRGQYGSRSISRARNTRSAWSVRTM